MSEADPQKPPVWMKSHFTPDEHRVWESIFPPLAGKPTPDESGFVPRRRRPSELYMSKIVRSLAELGVYPVARTTARGDLVPWDTAHEPQQYWHLDPGIRTLLGNSINGSDPEGLVDAYYHPADLAAHFGADARQWKNWPQGMTGVRPGPSRDDVVLNTCLDETCIEYVRRRGILRRPQSRTSLVSTGGVAFFACAAVGFWDTADERARIGRLKTKLEVDFHVLRNSAPVPEDPAIRDLITGELPDDVVGATAGGAARPRSVPSRRGPGLPEHERQVPLPEIAPTPPANPMTLEEELLHLEGRANEVRRLIEVGNIEAKRRRYEDSAAALRNAFGAARIVVLDFCIPDFDPGHPDGDPGGRATLGGLTIELPDGRQFLYGPAVPLQAHDADADRAAFEVSPVEYTFGG